MVKESVLEMANSCVEQYCELNTQLNQEQITKEENKIPLQQRHDELQENIVTLKTNDQELADKIIKLKIEHSELTDRIVADEEATAMRDIQNTLEREIEALTETEKQLQKTYEVHVASINEIRPCNALLEKMLQFEFDDSSKNLRNELAELHALYDKFGNSRTA
uniref:Uncharacterized protein n=1 Tax=Anopheles stephensi TaxID=30069 RepID=A0A182YI40_ANOST